MMPETKAKTIHKSHMHDNDIIKRNKSLNLFSLVFEKRTRSHKQFIDLKVKHQVTSNLTAFLAGELHSSKKRLASFAAMYHLIKAVWCVCRSA